MAAIMLGRRGPLRRDNRHHCQHGTDTAAAAATDSTASVANAAGPTLTTLVSFSGPNGQYPYSVLLADAAGDLFGTTNIGGANGDGTVFEIAMTGGSYASTPTTLASFNEAGGQFPHAGLIADAAGDLFSTTAGTVASTVFEIAKTGTGYATTPTILASFNFTDGSQPESGLIADAAGDLFGTTEVGGGARSLHGVTLSPDLLDQRIPARHEIRTVARTVGMGIEHLTDHATACIEIAFGRVPRKLVGDVFFGFGFAFAIRGLVLG